MTDKTPIALDDPRTSAERIAAVQAELNDKDGSKLGAVVTTLAKNGANLAEETAKLAARAATTLEGPPHTHLFIPEADPNIEVSEATGYTQEPSKGGVYLNQSIHRLWLPVDVPAGHVTLHIQGDPEAIGGHKRVGISDKDIEFFAGDFIPRWMGASFRPPEEPFVMAPWVKWAAIAGGAVLVVGMAVYLIIGWV